MFFTKAECTIFVGITQIILVLCDSKPAIPEKLPKPSAFHQNTDKTDDLFNVFPIFSIKEPEIFSFQKNIEDTLKQMKKEMDMQFRTDLEGFPIIAGLDKTPPVVPLMNAHERSEEPMKGKLSKPKPRTEISVGEPGDEIPENEDPTIRILKALGAALGGEPDRQRDVTTDGPLDIGKIFRQFEDLTRNTEVFGPLASDEETIYITEVDNTRGEPDDIGGVTFVRIDDGGSPTGFIPLQKIEITIPLNELPDVTAMPSNDTKVNLENFFDGFVDTMKKMMNLMQKTVNSTMNITTPDKNKLDIEIEDHGSIYNIPSDAYVNRKNPELVNITWPSTMHNFNNSLCLKVSKDESGNVVFQHVRLNILKDNEIHEYNLEEPTLLRSVNDNCTTIKLGEGVGVKFPNPESLDVVVVEKRETFSTHWLAFSVALLGLLVGGLIMLLSYIMHSRNKMYTRKDSISKVPIA